MCLFSYLNIVDRISLLFQSIMWQEGDVFRSNLVKEGELSGAAISHNIMNSIWGTPQTKGIHAGQHVKIVTPDAASSIVNSKYDTGKDVAMASPALSETTPSSPIRASPASTGSLQEQIAASTIKEDAPKEGDQANALLERKLRQNLNQFM